MSEPLYKYEAGFIQTLKSATCKTFAEWLSAIETSGLVERRAIREWLQENYKLDYMPAHKLSFLFMENKELHGPRVVFGRGGRSGKVHYESSEGSFDMYWELGGGDTLAIIDVPTEAQWESRTKLPLEKRSAILDFIGKKTVEQQTSNGKGSYEVQPNCILIR